MAVWTASWNTSLIDEKHQHANVHLCPLRCPVSAAILSSVRSAFTPRTQLNFDPPFFLNLLAPAILLGALFKISAVFAARWGVMFSAQAAIILYAYFALARAVYIHNNSRDRDGRHDRARAKKAAQDFHRAAKKLWPTVLPIPLAIVVVAAILDVLTSERQMAMRDVVELLIMIVEIIVWYCVAHAFIIACAKWTPLSPPNIAEARQIAIAHKPLVRSSFTLLASAWCFVSLFSMSRLYPPLRSLVISIIPSDVAAYLFAIAFFACLAGFALWIQCVWSVVVLAGIAKSEQPAAHPASRPQPVTTISWPSLIPG